MLLMLAAMMLATAAPVGAMQSEAVIVLNQVNGRGWPDVTITLTLTGVDGNPLPGVDVSQFEVSENGQAQQVNALDLGSARSVPLAIILAMDVSGSMAGDKLAQAKAAASTFAASLRPEDVMTLLAFSDRPREIVAATNDSNAVRAGIESLQADGNTAAYDALYRSAELVNVASPNRRRVIVLLSDGADTSSRYSSRVASDVAQKTGALVYTIGLGPDAVDSVLKELSEPSGGRYYKAPSSTDLTAIFDAISLELSSQMVLRYTSTTRMERSYKLVSVQVKYVGDGGGGVVGVERTIRYRPPPTSVLQPTSEPVLSIPTPLVEPIGLGSTTSLTTTRGTGTARELAAMPISLRYAGSALAGIAVLLIAVGIASTLSPSLVSQRVAVYVGEKGHITVAEIERPPSFVSRALLPFVSGLGKRLARFTPMGYTAHIEGLLLLLGPPYKLQMGAFLGMQFAGSIILALPLVLYALYSSPGIPIRWVLMGLLGLALGFYIPYFWLARRVGRRQRELLRALPGALDFLAINVEAGMGLDAAITEVVKRWRNPLTDELALLLIDFQIGKPRKDGWRDLMNRTRLPDLSSFVTSMLQNEQVGGSIGHLLRTQAEYMRGRRRQRAEEIARVAPVKMLLPMVLFIFPGILVITIGPAIPQIIDAFGGINK